MKRSMGLLLLLTILGAPVAPGQVSFNIVIRTPTPAELPAWERDRTIVTVAITNAGQVSYPDLRVSFVIRNTDNGRTVARSRDADPSMPRFSLRPLSTLVRGGADVVSVGAVEIDADIRMSAVTTNRLPEGNFQFCARLIDAAGAEVGVTGELCRPFIVLIPDPPSLQLPEDGSPLVSTGLPTFRWTPVPGAPGEPPMTYLLRIAPIFSGQLSRDAIERNTPLLTKTMITTSYTYLPGDPPFALQPASTGFAWQVQAITSAGLPAARNEGKSEIFTLTREGDLRVSMDYPPDGRRLPDEQPPFIIDVAGDRAGRRTLTLLIQELDRTSRAVIREAGRYSGAADLPAVGPFLLLNSPTGGSMNAPLLGSGRWGATPGRLYLWTVEMSTPAGRTIRNSASFSTDPVAVALEPAEGREPTTLSPHFFFRYERPVLPWTVVPGFAPGAASLLLARLILTTAGVVPVERFRDSIGLAFTTFQNLENTISLPTLPDGSYRWRVETVHRGRTIATSETAEFVVRGTVSCSNPCTCVDAVFPAQNDGRIPVSPGDLPFSVKFRPRINPTAIRLGTIRVWYRQPSPDGSLGTEGDSRTISRTPDFILTFNGSDMIEAASTEEFAIYNLTAKMGSGIGLRLRDSTNYLWTITVEGEGARMRRDGVACSVGRTEGGPYFFSTPPSGSAVPCSNPCTCVEPVFPAQNDGRVPVTSGDLSFSLKFLPRINPAAIRLGTIRVWYREPSPDGSFGTEGDRRTTARTPDFTLTFSGSGLTEATSTESYGIYSVTPRTAAGAGLRLRESTHYLWNLTTDYDGARIRRDGVACRLNRTDGGPYFFTTPPPASEPRDEGECADDCSAPAPTNTTPATLAFTARDTVRVGKFAMALTRVTGTGAALSGEGTIVVPFLRAPIQVEFSSIQVNGDRQMYGGTITAKQSTSSPLDAALANRGGSELGMTNEQIRDVQSYASDPLRLVSALVATDPVGLPLGFDRTIDGKRLVIGVIGMVFSPTNATLNAVASYDLPRLGPGMGIGLGAREICFHPRGLGGDGRKKIYLAHDFGSTSDEARMGFTFKAPTPTDSGTYILMDCHGWKELRIRAETLFPRSWFTPAPDDGRRAKAAFTLTVRNDSGWIADATIERIRLTSGPGLEMEVLEMAVDLSDVANPTGILFPAGFDGERDNTWNGFFIRRAMVNLPETIRRSDGTTIQFSLNNVLIGDGGITFSARAENLVRGLGGNISGMGISIDTLALDVVSSSAVRGWMTGLLRPPFTDSLLTYRALMGTDTAGGDFKLEFNMHARDTINFPIDRDMRMWISPTSRFDLKWIPNRGDAGVDMTIRIGGAFYWSSTSGSIPGIDYRGIEFEDFVYEKRGSSVSITPPAWEFASEQHKTAGFPVTITSMALVTGTRARGPGLGLQIGISVNLQPGSSAISGGSLLSAWGVFNTTSGRLESDGVDLDSIAINADLGVVRIRGGLRLYRTDATFGDGFRGNINANFLHEVEAEATMQVGNVRGLRYWYVDAKVALGSGVPIFSGVGMYGFGGGVWYHMRREGADPPVTTAMTSSHSATPGTTRSGYRFIPDSGTELGFRAMVILGTHPSPKAFNADVAFEATGISGGIGTIAVTGAGYMLAGIADRGSAKVTADVDIRYNFPTRTFHGDFQIHVRANPFTGDGRMVLHFDPSTWYLKIGEPEPRSSRVNLTLADWLRIDAYLMVGHDLPGPPPLPDYVTRDLPGFHVYRNPELATGDGFAFGASMTFDTGRKTFMIFYGQLRLEAGFDFSLLNFGPGTTCSGTGGPIGINGWYAQGQIYASITAAIGLHVDLWFVEGDFEIASLTASAALAAGSPNPTWVKGAVGGRYSILGGAISGHFDFRFEMGEECRPVIESPLTRMDLISDFQPADGSRNVDVFTEPQAAFNIKLDGPFDLVQTEGDGRTTVRTFRVRVREFSLATADSRTSVAGRWVRSDDSIQATLSPTNMLAGLTRHTARVAVFGEEFLSGRWVPALRRDGTSIEQLVTSNFVTGTAPDTIPSHQVAFSYPLDRQRYFLQGEDRNGVVALKIGMPTIFEARPRYRATLTARFIPTFGGADVESPARYNASSRRLEFAVPALSLSTVYALQIVKRETPVSGSAGTSPTFPSTSIKASASLRELLAGASGVATLREYKLSGAQAKQGEKLLYFFWFRTSQFSSLSEKIGALEAATTEASPPLGNIQLLTASYTAPEQFDVYDQEGFQVGPSERIGPLVRVSAASRANRWHTSFTNPWIYDPIQRFRAMGQWTATVQFERYQAGMSALALAEFVNRPQPLLRDNERSPAPPSAKAIPGLGLSAPTVRIQHNHGVVAAMDFAAVRTKAASFLATGGGGLMTPDLDVLLRSIVSRRFELYTRGSYSLRFSYNLSGILALPRLAPQVSASFTY